MIALFLPFVGVGFSTFLMAMAAAKGIATFKVFVILFAIVMFSALVMFVMMCFIFWTIRIAPPEFYDERDIPSTFRNGLNNREENIPQQMQNHPPLITNLPSPINNISPVGEDQAPLDEIHCVSDYARIDNDDNDDNDFANFKIRKHFRSKYFVYDDDPIFFKVLKEFESHYSLESILQDNIGIDTSNFEPEELKTEAPVAPLARADEFLGSAEKDFYKPAKINRELGPLVCDSMEPDAAQSSTMSHFDLPHIDSDETIPLFH